MVSSRRSPRAARLNADLDELALDLGRRQRLASDQFGSGVVFGAGGSFVWLIVELVRQGVRVPTRQHHDGLRG